MKVNSISGFTCYVEDLARTAEFYEALGFRRGKDGPDRVTFYVNWFFVTFISKQHADAPKKRGTTGSGIYVNIKVDDLGGFYEDVVASGLDPTGEPDTGPSGIREFGLEDPDGYHLLFFDKK
jgi:catechol 2,3-dioxygenase-like lactoylglutathione lyase family enzyme